MRITVLAGGIGAARFLRGLLAATESFDEPADITVIGNTGDDITLYGLRVSPDLDSVMYTLGGGNDEAQGWGRADETWNALAEVTAYGGAPAWFGLGDRDLGTHLVRTSMLYEGHPLSEVTALLCARWSLPVRLIPMTDERVETHVYVEDPAADDGRRRLHFQEYWVRHHAGLPVADLEVEGIEQARPAPGVLEAITKADLIVFPPSNPVVSIGPILAVPGIRDAVRSAAAPVVGISPIIGGAPVRGMADKLLPAIGVDTSASGVALHFGSRSDGGLLDGWLVDSRDEAAVAHVQAAGIACRALPLLMSDVEATAEIARAALEVAEQVKQQ
ncbi:2-phospho-L-lactate transferase [Flindersiella endophytica]